jgi:WD40 repeat protein
MKQLSILLVIALLLGIFGVTAQDTDTRSAITIGELGQLEEIITLGEGDITALDFSRHENVLAAGSMSGSIWLWEVASGTELLSLNGHTSEVGSLAFSPDGTLLASAGGATVKLWETATGAELQSLDNPAIAVEEGQSDFVCDMEFSPDGSLLAVGTCESSGDNNNQIVRIWDTSSWEIIGTQEGGTGDVEFDDEGTLFTFNGVNILQWNATDGQLEIPPSDSQATVGVSTLSISADGSHIALADYDNNLLVSDMAGNEWVGKAHENFIIDIAFNADASIVVSRENSLYFDPAAGLLSMTWLPANTLVTLWDVESGEELVTLDIASAAVLRSMAFSSDGTLLVFGTDAGAQIWGIAATD